MDIVIAVVAVIAIVGSIAGAALYEEPTDGIEYQVNFVTDEHALDEVAEQVAGGGPTGGNAQATTTHNITHENITEITFDVTVTSSTGGGLGLRGGSISVTVTLMDPDGNEAGTGTANIAQTDTTTTVSVTATDINPMPNATTVQAGSLDEARMEANETHIGTNGIGDWTVQVDLGYPNGPAETGQVRVTPTVTTYHTNVTLETRDVSGAA